MKPLILCLSLVLPLASCTLIKPVTCAIVHPAVSVVALFQKAGQSDDSGEQYEQVPIGLAIVEVSLLLPVFYAYKTAVGAVGGLFSGFVSDLNTLSGNADFDATLDTIANPTRVNQRKRE